MSKFLFRCESLKLGLLHQPSLSEDSLSTEVKCVFRNNALGLKGSALLPVTYDWFIDRDPVINVEPLLRAVFEQVELAGLPTGLPTGLAADIPKRLPDPKSPFFQKASEVLQEALNKLLEFDDAKVIQFLQDENECQSVEYFHFWKGQVFGAPCIAIHELEVCGNELLFVHPSAQRIEEVARRLVPYNRNDVQEALVGELMEMLCS